MCRQTFDWNIFLRFIRCNELVYTYVLEIKLDQLWNLSKLYVVILDFFPLSLSFALTFNTRMSSFKSSSACFRKGFTHQNESKRDVVIDIVYVTCYSARIIWILLVVNWLLLSLLDIAHNLCHIFNASPSPSCIIYSSVLPFGSFYAPACRLCERWAYK